MEQSVVHVYEFIIGIFITTIYVMGKSKDFSSQLDRATKVYLEQHVRVLKDNEV